MRSCLASAQAPAGGWSGKASASGSRAPPLREVEHELGEIGFQDFRPVVFGQRRRLRLVPQPVAHAGLRAPRAAASLVGRCARDLHRLEPGEARRGLVARNPGEPGIDDDPHALDGQRGLRDRCRQHHLAHALGGGLDRRILFASRQRAVERGDGHVRRKPLAEHLRDPADLSLARQEHEDRARLLGQCLANGLHRFRLQPGGRVAAEIARLDGIHPALAFDDRRIAQKGRDLGGIQRCGHDEEAQVFAQGRLHVERQRQAEVAVEAALVEFVEENGCDAGKVRIVQDHPREDALGNDLDAGARGDLRLHPHAVAHRLAGLLAKRRGHASCCGACRETARLQHENAAIAAPGSFQKRQRNARRLARTGTCDEDGIRPAFQHAQEFRQDLFDR